MPLTSDLPQTAAVEVDESGVGFRGEAVVHGLIIDLEKTDAVWFGMAVGGAEPAPFGVRQIVEVVTPVHRIIDLVGLAAGRGQYDERLGIELAAETEKLIRAESVIVRVAAPEGVGMVATRRPVREETRSGRRPPRGCEESTRVSRLGVGPRASHRISGPLPYGRGSGVCPLSQVVVRLNLFR